MSHQTYGSTVALNAPKLALEPLGAGGAQGVLDYGADRLALGTRKILRLFGEVRKKGTEGLFPEHGGMPLKIQSLRPHFQW